MNILASYDWIKEFVAYNGAPEEFMRKISLSGPSVERAYPQAALFDKMAVGVVMEVAPHPNPKADKLRLVKTSLGARTISVVCGGTNLAVGMKVAVALPGAKVRWHGEREPVELAPAEIRGVKSEGMICAANEIGLAAAFPHPDREILDIGWCAAAAGAPLSDALEMDDTVFDIEVTTNRPDAFSIVGLAREASAILGRKFLWKPALPPRAPKPAESLPLRIKNTAPKLCARYQAVAMDGVKIGPSPWWLKKRLLMSGLRPINNVVDITNYVMLEQGQPMHVFDYAKLDGRAIAVRPARAGERLAALDGSAHEFAGGELVIADAQKPAAVAGIMGGIDSAVAGATTAIVFEAAAFDPVSVRRTARKLNLHSDSSLRFEKGLPEEATAPALARAAELCGQIAGGRIASRVFDERSAGRRRQSYGFRPAKAAALIGISIPEARMKTILGSLGFGVRKAAKGSYSVSVPYWRSRDIESERDFTEEIARVYGYHNLPSVLPSGEIPLEPPNGLLAAERRVKEFLRAAGLTELLTYSFVSREQLEKSGFNPAEATRIANPLSADFEFMRPSLIPGVLAAIARNQGLFPEGKVFEVSGVYESAAAGGLPKQRTRLLAAIYGRTEDDRLFRAAKGWCETICDSERLRGASYEPVRDDPRWHPGRSARLFARDAIGLVGELHPSLLRRFGLDCRVAAFDLDLEAFVDQPREERRYLPPDQYPPVRRDLAVVVNEEIEYTAVRKTLFAANPLLRGVSLFDVYRGENIGAGKKSVAVHLEFAERDRTLTAEEADAAMKDLIGAAEKNLGGVVRV